MQDISAEQSERGGSTQLLRSIAEQLTSPLTVISREAELVQLTQNNSLATIATIHSQATAALTLVESYLLGLQLIHEQSALVLEPVSISSLLVGVAHELSHFAKQYDIDLEIHIAGKYQPVMAHAAGLRSVFLSLGYALLEAYSLPQNRLTLAVHRTPHGIVTGLYGDYGQVSSQQWRKALELQGRANQTFATLCKGSGAGLFVAETILQAMSTRLRVGKHRNLHGLATTLQPSLQLQFV